MAGGRLLYPLAALASGLIFGAGLAVAGMTDPAKIKAFLDIAAIPSGGWDPSLAFVLAAAVIVTMAAVRLGQRRRVPLAASTFDTPAARRIDGRFILGSALFGIGWGLAGLCPGPAIANLAFLMPDILVFLVAMVAGTAIVRIAERRRAPADALGEAGEKVGS